MTATDLGLLDTAPGECGQPEPDYSERVVVLGRLKPGTASESRRVVHVFQLPRDNQRAAVLTAACGEPLAVDDMQWLPGMTGMPCEPCLMRGDDAGLPAHRPPFGYSMPSARRDPALVTTQQRRLLGGMATPPAGTELSW